MSDNEVKTVFTAEDKGGAVVTQAGNNIKEFAKKAEEAGQANEQAAHHHLSARHALGLVASQTGMATGELMHFYHALHMVPGPLGIALAGVMMLKAAVTEYREKQEKARESLEAFEKVSAKFYEENFGQAKPGGLAGENFDQLRESRDKLRELQEKRAAEGMGVFGPSAMARALDEQIDKQQEIITLLMKRTPLEMSVANAIRAQAAAMFEAEMHRGGIGATFGIAEKRRERSEDMEDALQRADIEKAAMEQSAKGSKAYEEHEKAYREAKRAAHKLAVEDNRDMAAAQESHRKTMQEGDRPLDVADSYDKRAAVVKAYRVKEFEDKKNFENGVLSIEKNGYLTTEQKEAEKTVLKKRYNADREQEDKDHQKRLAEIDEESANFINGKQASILESTGRHYEAQLAQLESEHERERNAHRTNADELEAIDDAYESKRADLQRQHALEKEQFYTNSAANIFSSQGKSYEAELTRLQSWYSKETDLHRGHADELALIEQEKQARLADIERRHSEFRRNTHQKFTAEIIEAEHGSGAAGLYRMVNATREEMAELRRRGEDDLADEAQTALQAKLSRMGIEAQRSLAGKRQVGFTSLEGGWQSFTSSLGASPDEQEKKRQTRDLIVALRDVSKTVRERGVTGVLTE